MKLVILAGGLGTRISEETSNQPKPMVMIGERPIIWHIMKIFSCYGINDFIICCGYKGYVIKEYFANYYRHTSDFKIDLSTNKLEIFSKKQEDWRISLIDTGHNTQTGGRLKRIEDYVDDTFFMTYGDGLADINVQNLLEFHKNQGGLATVTSVQPPGRFGSLKIEGENVTGFVEKPETSESRINGGFFALEPGALNYIDGDNTAWEGKPIQRLVENRELRAFKHDGFWRPMDTLRDKSALEQMWHSGQAPWKIW